MIGEEEHVVPEDLSIEILVRLPVKSLIRLKCVCKSWCSIINSPSFIDKHLVFNYHKEETTNLYYLLVKTIYTSTINLTASNYFTRILSYNTLGVVEPNQLLAPCPYPQDEYNYLENINIVGSCNGLVFLCAYDSSDTFVNNWVLWNPATGETKIIPTRNGLLRPESSSVVGFNFDSQSKDYKVVEIHKNGHDMMEVWVYSLRTNTWREVSSFSGRRVYFNRAHVYDGVFSNGMYSWWAYKRVNQPLGHAVVGYVNEIISFDMSNEVIKRTPLPHCLRNCVLFEPDQPFVYKDSLALYEYETYEFDETYDKLGRRFDIWALGEYGVEESWSKLFTIEPIHSNVKRVLGFWSDEKVFVETDDQQLFVHDLATQKMTSIQSSRGNMKLIYHTESLLRIESS